MAIITEFIKDNNKRIRNNISDTTCIYNSRNVNGEKVCVISTTGSKDRVVKGSVSQTIHFNKESAEEMIKILRNEFDL